MWEGEEVLLNRRGSEILLSGGTLVFSTDPKNEVIDVLVIAKGKDQLGGEEQANGGEESNKGQQSNGEMSDWEKANVVVGAAMTANGVKSEIMNFAERTSDIGKQGAKYVKIVNKIGVAGNLYGMGVAGTNIYQDLKNGNRINGWDVSDLTIGGASIAATIFLASNPVGWMITGGATFYFGARLIYDVVKSR